ncbi:MAG: GPW/gp25 family protein [Bacteroidales bacterium]
MQTIILGNKNLESSISDNIRTLILTTKGSVPFRPNFGLGAERLLGGNMQAVDIAYEVAEQITRYEKRIRLIRTTSAAGDRAGSLLITIKYQILISGTTKQQIINI